MDISPTTTATCPFVQLPTETIRDIFDQVKDQQDRIRLAQTCKRFKKILALDLYSALRYPVHNGPCLLALRGLVFNTVSKQVRTLHISPRGSALSSPSWKHLSSVLAACIHHLPNLRDFHIHPGLLNNLLLNNVLLSTIPYLRFNYPLTSTSFPLETLEGSLLPRLTSLPPLEMPARFAIWVTSKADATWVNDVLLFFHRLGIKALYLELLILADLGTRSKLLLEHDVGLRSVRVSTSPDFVLPLLPWMSDFQSSTMISQLSVNVRSPLEEGGFGRDDYDDPSDGDGDFALASRDWLPCPRLINMTPWTPEEDFLEHWGGIGFHHYFVETSGEDGIESVELELAPGHTLGPSHLLSLLDHLPVTRLHISAVSYVLSWSDWPSTVVHLADLSSIFLGCSLTPIPTLFDVLTCSNCKDSFPTTHPQLHRDAQLIGGSDALWNVTYEVNLARLVLLGEQLDSEATVLWNVMGEQFDEQAWVGWYEGGSYGQRDESGKWTTTFVGSRLKKTGRQREVGIEACLCSTCSEMDVDPVSKLRMCPVEEVRAALVKGGFDLVRFDASPLSADAGPESLEVFLRTGCPSSAGATT